jgi:tRNA nucleotidyltransferase/poly(A) polymerase
MVQIDTKIFPKTPGAFIVGGSIRDMLCGRWPTDYDVAVLGDPLEFARRVQSKTNGRLVKIGKPGRMILRVIGEGNIVDVSETKGGSIEQDLQARDFTINAMAYELSSQRLIDPMKGQQDLKNRIVRMVSGSVFDQDPVRLLRAFRMAAAFQFEIESQTKTSIKKKAALIRNSANERVREEFFKMLQCARAHPYLCQMADTGLLFYILPELSALKKCTQNRYHQFNAFEHTLSAFYHLEELLETNLRHIQIKRKPLAHKIGGKQVPLLKISMLLHDVGKPDVQTMDGNDALHFYDHERHGAKMAEAICKRLKCSNRDVDTIYFLVRHHMRPFFVFTALQKQNATRRAVARFFMKCAANTPALLILAAADMLGKEKQQSQQSSAFINFIKQLMLDYETDYKPKNTSPPLITGHDLINAFGLKPSPLFKKILNRVEIERLSRNDMTRQEAVDLVRELIQDQSLK